MKELIDNYHLKSCEFYEDPESGCTCGLINLVEEIREQDIKAFEEILGEDEDIKELDAKMRFMGTPETVRDISSMAERFKNNLRAELRTKLDQYKNDIIAMKHEDNSSR